MLILLLLDVELCCLLIVVVVSSVTAFWRRQLDQERIIEVFNAGPTADYYLPHAQQSSGPDLG